MYNLTTEQFLKIPIAEAWNFFSSPKNLALITPPEMGFKIISGTTDEPIFEGMQINYIVKPLLGIPLKWKTEIGKTEVNKLFTDKQLKGPYKLWYHRHTFIEQNNGVLMRDEVSYQLPLGIIGKLAHRLFVRKKIESIFEFRRKVLDKMFVNDNPIK